MRHNCQRFEAGLLSAPLIRGLDALGLVASAGGSKSGRILSWGPGISIADLAVAFAQLPRGR